MTNIAMLPELYSDEDLWDEMDEALEDYGFFSPKKPIVEDDFDIEVPLYEWDLARERWLEKQMIREEQELDAFEQQWEHLPKTGKMRLDSCREAHKGWYYRRRELIGQRPRSTQRWNTHRRFDVKLKCDPETYTTTRQENYGSKRGHKQSWKMRKQRHQFEGRGYHYGMIPKLRGRNTISQLEQDLDFLNDIEMEANDY